MKAYYRGAQDGGLLDGTALDGRDLTGMQVRDLPTSNSSRPFNMYTEDSKLVAVGKAYMKGLKMVDIEKAYGMSRRNITRFVRKAGLPVRPRHRPRNKPKQACFDWDATPIGPQMRLF